MKRAVFLLAFVVSCFIGITTSHESGASGACYYKQADLQVLTHPDIFKWKWSKRVKEVTPEPVAPEPGDLPTNPTTPVVWKPMPEKVVYFDYDKAVLKPEAKAAIQTNVQFLKDKPDAKILIEGHCDERGTEEYNLALGERRAESVKNYMIDLGVSASRITTKSWGEERPVDTGHSESAWSKNRRGEMFFSEE